jgi:hypothetical protein
MSENHAEPLNRRGPQPAVPLRALDEQLTRAVDVPPVDAVIRRAATATRAGTAATAGVLTVGILGVVTIVAQMIATGSAPLPAPAALAPEPPFALADPSRPPVVATVLNPGERLIRLNPGAATPAGARAASNGTTAVPADDRAVEAEPAQMSETAPAKRDQAMPAPSVAGVQQPKPAEALAPATRALPKRSVPQVPVRQKEQKSGKSSTLPEQLGLVSDSKSKSKKGSDSDSDDDSSSVKKLGKSLGKGLG